MRDETTMTAVDGCSEAGRLIEERQIGKAYELVNRLAAEGMQPSQFQEHMSEKHQAMLLTYHYAYQLTAEALRGKE